jgi:hypothetical protein
MYEIFKAINTSSLKMVTLNRTSSDVCKLVAVYPVTVHTTIPTNLSLNRRSLLPSGGVIVALLQLSMETNEN